MELAGQLARAAAEVEDAHRRPRLDEVEEVEEGGAPLAQELRVLARVPEVRRHARDRIGRRTMTAVVSVAKKRLLLYGANGYTGRLILDAALARGLPVTVAGRRIEAIEPLAKERGVPFEVFALDEAPRRLADCVSGFGALLLAAGPFSRTSGPVVAACLKAKVPYLDITGEIGVFEAVFARHADAVKAGVALLPGVGFDVVPSDCLAASLAAALPGAVRLQLAFRGFGISAGTARTMLEGLPKGGRRARRRQARLRARRVEDADDSLPRPAPLRRDDSVGRPLDRLPLHRDPEHRDVHGDGPLARLGPPVGAVAPPVAGFAPVQALVSAWMKKGVAGPTAEERARERSLLWGRVEDGEGRAAEGSVETLEGYALTAETAVLAAERVLRGERDAGGVDALAGLRSGLHRDGPRHEADGPAAGGRRSGKAGERASGVRAVCRRGGDVRTRASGGTRARCERVAE